MTSCVPFQKTVTACVTCMAQPLITLTTKPGGEHTTMVNIAMKSTMSTGMSWPIVVCQSDRVMPEWKGADDRCSTTSASATTVLPNEILCQAESKGLVILEGTTG